MARERDYSYEALAEVTASDPSVARGQLNAALKAIRDQEPEVDDYLLSCEIHERAQMYRAVFSNAALTPTALAKHWQRVLAETKRTPRVPEFVPDRTPAPRERNLAEVHKLRKAMGWE